SRSETVGDLMARRQMDLPARNDRRELKLSERAPATSSLLKPFSLNDLAARRERRAEFKDDWAESHFRRDARASFLTRSVATTIPIPEQRGAALSNNWRGDRFAGRQYWAFRNYQHQWHDSSWWHH